MKRDRDDDSRVTDSSGNIFADLDLPHSEEDMLKVKLARAISHTIEKGKLTQVEAASMLGTDQARISEVVRGRLDGFSVDRLLGFLAKLGHDVDIHISRHKKRLGRIKVSACG